MMIYVMCHTCQVLGSACHCREDTLLTQKGSKCDFQDGGPTWGLPPHHSRSNKSLEGPILTKGGGGWGGGVITLLRWLPATAGQIFVTRCHEERH